eukprot:scaffold244104_cov21-Tisochrysis_lutea.AAC.1
MIDAGVLHKKLSITGWDMFCLVEGVPLPWSTTLCPRNDKEAPSKSASAAAKVAYSIWKCGPGKSVKRSACRVINGKGDSPLTGWDRGQGDLSEGRALSKEDVFSKGREGK